MWKNAMAALSKLVDAVMALFGKSKKIVSGDIVIK